MAFEGLMSGLRWGTDDKRTLCILGIHSWFPLWSLLGSPFVGHGPALMRVFWGAQQVDCLLVGRLISCAVGTIFS